MSRAALAFVTWTLGADHSVAPPTFSDEQWVEALGFANDHLLAPALHGALQRRGTLSDIPADVGDYLRHLATANEQRNDLVYAQGIELAARLNAVGIVPMFLKSAADLMEDAPVLGRDGIVGDLDVLVPAEAAETAADALAEIGYRPLGDLEPNDHTYADLGRDQDAATVDLHTGVLDLGHLLPAEDMLRGGTTVVRQGVRFGVPSVENRLLHRLIHDQIQGRGLYTGRLHLGHAWRTAWMLRQHGSIDWTDLARRAARHRLTTALHGELLSAGLFAPTDSNTPTIAARVLHGWRMARLAHPRIRIPGEAFADVIDLYTRARFFARGGRVIADDS